MSINTISVIDLQFKSTLVDSKRNDLVGQVDTAAGDTQIIEKSGDFPPPTFPVSPATEIVSVPPSVAVVGESAPVTDVTLFAFALIVS